MLANHSNYYSKSWMVKPPLRQLGVRGTLHACAKNTLAKRCVFLSISLQEQFMLIFLSLNIFRKSKEIIEINTSIEHIYKIFYKPEKM